MRSEVYFTYTCPVSRKTYAGHPRDGYLYTHDNDLEEAINIIHSIARKHRQPVTWVINDQEYSDQEKLLHYFQKFQSEGDSILVTMELTTSPPEVDKFDTAAVIKWIGSQCDKAELRIDGLWSLRFLESDLKAIRTLDPVKYAWARNLAGACWHQLGIDDSTWGGCSYGPYYVSTSNVRASAQPGEPNDFLMLEWVSRDITAILRGGYPATFTLDPADANRIDAGGFDNEPDALKYSQQLIYELARQRSLNPLTVINVNEEARHFQTEGHDKAYMLDGMFACADEIDKVKRATYADVFARFREREKTTPERLLVCNNVDWRNDEDLSALYEDAFVQMGFLRSKGNLPVEVFDYSAQHSGSNANDAYPMSNPTGVCIVSKNVQAEQDRILISLNVTSQEHLKRLGMVVWDTPAHLDHKVEEKSENISKARVGLQGCVFILADLVPGENLVSLRLRAK